MSAGDLPAGEDLAGDDTPPAVSAPRNVRPPAAVLYDGATRDFPRDTNGLYIEEHPTDQKVGLALIVLQGTVAGSPTLGSKLRQKRTLNPDTITTEILYVVKTALADLLKAKEIALIEVDVQIQGDSRLLVRVVYDNLLLDASTARASGRTKTKVVTFG